MTQWIDTHVHLFTDATKGEAPVLINGQLNSVDYYLQSFAAQKPAGVVVADFSKAATSDHVVATVPQLQAKGIPASGIIRANINNPNTFDWIKLPSISGIRLYAKEGLPDFSEKAKWNQLFTLARANGKHLCVFGDPVLLRQLFRQLPEDLPLLVDHLGCGDVTKGADADAEWNAMLGELAARNKSAGAVYFKGPGYRTSFDVKKTAPFLRKILDQFGDGQVMLGASDAPFAGPVMETSGKYVGLKNQDAIGYASILDYLTRLIETAAEGYGKSAEMLAMQLLYSNAQKLYKFEAGAQKAA